MGKKAPMPKPGENASIDDVVKYINWGSKHGVFKKKAGRAKLIALITYVHSIEKIHHGVH